MKLQTLDRIAVAVFVKTPGLSLSKTRLAKTVGHDSAEELYGLLLARMNEVREGLRGSERFEAGLSWIWAVAEDALVVRDSRYWKEGRVVSQVPGQGQWGDGKTQATWSLGDRIQWVWNQLDAEYDAVIILGADSPALTPTDLRDAIVALDTGSAVIGRARDGGFYLFGARRGVMGGRDWLGLPYSSAETADAVVERAARIGVIPHELRALSDLDECQDVPRVREELLALVGTERELGGAAVGDILEWLDRQRSLG